MSGDTSEIKKRQLPGVFAEMFAGLSDNFATRTVKADGIVSCSVADYPGYFFKLRAKKGRPVLQRLSLASAGAAVNFCFPIGEPEFCRIQGDSAVATKAFNFAFALPRSQIKGIGEGTLLGAVKGHALVNRLAWAGGLYYAGFEAIHCGNGRFAFLVDVANEFAAVESLVAACR